MRGPAGPDDDVHGAGLRPGVSARYGPKVTLIAGLLIIAAGYGGGLGLMSAAWQTVLTSVVLGAGIGLAYSSPCPR